MVRKSKFDAGRTFSMSLSEFELRKIEKYISAFCEKRIRAVGRDRLEISYRVLDNEVWMFERRPRWDNPSEWNEFAFARILCDMDTRVWRLYWQDQNRQWHPYNLLEPTRNFQEVLNQIDDDQFRFL